MCTGWCLADYENVRGLFFQRMKMFVDYFFKQWKCSSTIFSNNENGRRILIYTMKMVVEKLWYCEKLCGLYFSQTVSGSSILNLHYEPFHVLTIADCENVRGLFFQTKKMFVDYFFKQRKWSWNINLHCEKRCGLSRRLLVVHRHHSEWLILLSLSLPLRSVLRERQRKVIWVIWVCPHF